MNPAAQTADPVAAFVEAASVSLQWHTSGTLAEAEAILAKHPGLAQSSIYAAASLADTAAVGEHIARNAASATAKGGPRGWDALTYLCFSRYLRLDRSRAAAFVDSARILLDAGADPNTGWIEMIDHPNPQPILETAIYGAAGLAQHAGLTRLLLERGADPNDAETAYHVSESRDNMVLRVLLASGKLNAVSLSTVLIRKCDCHDLDGLKLGLAQGADPNAMTQWGQTALHQALRRDNRLEAIECLLDHGADATLPNRDGFSAVALAAHRGRADALDLFERRGVATPPDGALALLAACARDQRDTIARLAASDPQAVALVKKHGGALLAQFAGNGNAAGVGHLLDLGLEPDTLFREGDGYFDIARMSTPLQVAAWRAQPAVVALLLGRGAAVNATDGRGRSALALAIKACVDSYWTSRRSPDSVRALLEAGAASTGVKLPTGYDAIDELLRRAQTGGQ